MKNKLYILIINIFISCVSFANNQKSAEKNLQVFLKCIAGENQDLEQMGKCTKPFFSSDLTQSQKKRLLGWFLLNPKLTIVDCDQKSIERAQRKYTDHSISYLCAVETVATSKAEAPVAPDSGYILVLKSENFLAPQLINLMEKR